MKGCITFQYDINSTFSGAANELSFSLLSGRRHKLRRVPHIFNLELELPFHSETEVSIQENSDCFQFIIQTYDLGDDVRAQTIEILPNIKKIVIRGSKILAWAMDELELDLWRCQLPLYTRPELASAVYEDGELIVTVPKGEE
ncbi:uncharacterized protein LOC143882871 [Tasmannia lanceolata]|uniref:uncharacterized protein LOC143882871 n=1 Tax=Tasmannia lanceolata TaxID=3420 RepID=UPI004064194B